MNGSISYAGNQASIWKDEYILNRTTSRNINHPWIIHITKYADACFKLSSCRFITSHLGSEVINYVLHKGFHYITSRTSEDSVFVFLFVPVAECCAPCSLARGAGGSCVSQGTGRADIAIGAFRGSE